MAGFATFVLRVVFLCAVPLVAVVVGVELDTSVVVLSIVAAIFEVVLFSFFSGTSGGKGKKGRHSIRPPQFFPLQVGLLYCLQLWLVMLHIHGPTQDVGQSAEVPVQRPHVSSGDVPLERLAGEGLAVVEQQPEAVKEEVQLQQVRADEAAGDAEEPIARYIEGQPFDLDAPLEKLKWKPKTISVVLPCAEERDYAFKTVQSFFEMTPGHVLHEIVVVDDGSNPPLAETHLKPDVQLKYKVKICRHDTTVGLIGAKKTGGDAASGDIVAFFDCHVAPQQGWYEDFLRLIGQNYRRMVVPQITGLNVDTWKQEGSGGGMSKCYVTWDGDFKWGGPDDMYMGMLSGGLAGMSKRWWDESGGFDSAMLGWGGENIDQGVRMWVCGGEIVAAPNAQVAHMWRTGSAKTNARYKHVGDTLRNRARAIFAWNGEYAQKLDAYQDFANRKQNGGDNWYGDMDTFQKVKDRLNGCRPFSWYLRRFKSVYEDGGLVPQDIFMIREEKSGKCLLFGGRAGTSGAGKETVKLQNCNPSNDRFYWHLGNVNRKTGGCCSGFRAWNSEQCFEGGDGRGQARTGICEITGRNDQQTWRLTEDGQLRHRDRCMGPGNAADTLQEAPCVSFRRTGGARFTKQEVKLPIETELYRRDQREHPEVFKLLNERLAAMERKSTMGPEACRKNPGTCVAFMYGDGSGRCLDDTGLLVADRTSCDPVRFVGTHVQRAETNDCLDSWSDNDPETWGFYGCHDGDNQKFKADGPSRVCSMGQPIACFGTQPWPVTSR